MVSLHEISIGALVPLSRPGWVEAGRQLLAGLEVGVTERNRNGGVCGRRLKLIVRDTAADEKKAVRAVEELAGVPVAAIVGEYHSVAARAAAERAEELKIPFLCSSAVLDNLVGKRSDFVARLAPPQSQGWRTYADFLLGLGHRCVAVAMADSIYWTAGFNILRERISFHDGVVAPFSIGESNNISVDDLLAANASALLLLVGYPEPAISIAQSVRRDRRTADLFIGTPAGQAELRKWNSALGNEGVAVPFLCYMPDRLPALGVNVGKALRTRLRTSPSFIAFEGYDAIVATAAALTACDGTLEPGAEPWSKVDTLGSRGRIMFSRVAGIDVWQWASVPIQIVDRHIADHRSLRVLRTASMNVRNSGMDSLR